MSNFLMKSIKENIVKILFYQLRSRKSCSGRNKQIHICEWTMKSDKFFLVLEAWVADPWLPWITSAFFIDPLITFATKDSLLFLLWTLKKGVTVQTCSNLVHCTLHIICILSRWTFSAFRLFYLPLLMLLSYHVTTKY